MAETPQPEQQITHKPPMEEFTVSPLHTEERLDPWQLAVRGRGDYFSSKTKTTVPVGTVSLQQAEGKWRLLALVDFDDRGAARAARDILEELRDSGMQGQFYTEEQIKGMIAEAEQRVREES